MIRFLVIFLFIISLGASDIKPDFPVLDSKNGALKVSKKYILPECLDLYKDYKYFYTKTKRSKEYKDGLSVRWEKVMVDYKEKFIECNNDSNELYKNYTTISTKEKENIIKKKYYKPNPYNR